MASAAGAMLALATVVAGVEARDAENNYVIYGLGGVSCGQWLHFREAKNDMALASWVLGYITAINTMPGHMDIAGGTDADGMLAWIDKYCSENPLDSVSAATSSLVSDLYKRLARKK